MPRGRPFQPGNKFGRGRPPGSRNKKSFLLEEFMEQYSEPILRQAFLSALKGDGPMLRMLLGYYLPKRKDSPPKTGSLPMGNATELSQSFVKLCKRVTSGKVTISEAVGFAQLMEHRQRSIETEGFEKQLQALKQRLDEKSELNYIPPWTGQRNRGDT